MGHSANKGETMDSKELQRRLEAIDEEIRQLCIVARRMGEGGAHLALCEASTHVARAESLIAETVNLGNNRTAVL